MTIQNQMKTMLNKKMPATFDNSSLCNPIQILDNQKIGDCVLATFLHMLKIQYKLIDKDFSIDETTLFFFGSSSDEKTFQLYKKILNYFDNSIPLTAPESYFVDRGSYAQQIFTYGKKFGLFGAYLEKMHSLSDEELMDVELLKRLIVYYGAIPVSVGLTYYEDNITANQNKVYTLDIPPGCPWSGIDVYNTFKSLIAYLKVDHYYDVSTPWGYESKHELVSVGGVPGFWRAAAFTNNQRLHGTNIFDLRTYNNQSTPDLEDIYRWTVDGKTSNQIKTMADKWNNWAKKSGAYVNGHEILLTGWDKDGFKFITWYGTGHMSYEYWYLHHSDGTVVIPKAWEEAMRGFEAKLLLSRL
jgi:hypothetical protein